MYLSSVYHNWHVSCTIQRTSPPCITYPVIITDVPLSSVYHSWHVSRTMQRTSPPCITYPVIITDVPLLRVSCTIQCTSPPCIMHHKIYISHRLLDAASPRKEGGRRLESRGRWIRLGAMDPDSEPESAVGDADRLSSDSQITTRTRKLLLGPNYYHGPGLGARVSRERRR
jgi:hypothetical protein